MQKAVEEGVGQRLEAVLGNISNALKASQNPDQSVQLVAVSKTFPANAIEPVLQAGQRVFGENRVQEAMGKWPEMKEQYPDVKLHLIGPLQTNKVAAAVTLFDCIETIDRPKLAKSIAKELGKQGKKIELFIQVNTGAEPQKAGILMDELPEFVRFCREDLWLDISGLMCIPPVSDLAKDHFLLLGKLARQNNMANLSMGMSADYQMAVKCGATFVRVGSAIFGQR